MANIGYNRDDYQALVPSSFSNPTSGDTSLGYFAGLTAPSIAITGETSIPGFGGTRQAVNHCKSYQAMDDLSFPKGKHDLKLGFAYERIQEGAMGPLKDGSATFLTLRAFLLNQPYAAQIPGPTTLPIEPIEDIYGFYLQDNWRATQRLSVSMGLRYEFTTKLADKRNPRIDQFALRASRNGSVSSELRGNLCSGMHGASQQLHASESDPEGLRAARWILL